MKKSTLIKLTDMVRRLGSGEINSSTAMRILAEARAAYEIDDETFEQAAELVHDHCGSIRENNLKRLVTSN